MRRRVYIEHLPADVLCAPTTLDYLTRYRLEPIVALPPARQTPAMARALGGLAAHGLPVGVWPLLTDDEGYWPSELNAARFETRVDEVLRFSSDAGVTVRTVAIDLEPPLQELEGLLAGSLSTRAGFVRSRRRSTAPDATPTFLRLRRSLDTMGIETIAAALPLVVLDLEREVLFWQSILKTPATNVEWSVVSPMLYTTMVAELLPTKRLDHARALLYASARRLRQVVGPVRSSVSVGLVGRGKLGTEPIYANPEGLALDVGAARAAGIEDLALFALEGVLSRRAPHRWFDAFVHAPPRRPPAVSRVAAEAFLRAARIATAVSAMATAPTRR